MPTNAAQNWRKMSRAWQLIHEEHRAKHAEILGDAMETVAGTLIVAIADGYRPVGGENPELVMYDRLNPEKVAEFQAWENGIWKPKMKRLSLPRNAAMEKRRKELKPDEMGHYLVLDKEKELGRVDTSFDAEIRSVI